MSLCTTPFDSHPKELNMKLHKLNPKPTDTNICKKRFYNENKCIVMHHYITFFNIFVTITLSMMHGEIPDFAALIRKIAFIASYLAHIFYLTTYVHVDSCI